MTPNELGSLLDYESVQSSDVTTHITPPTLLQRHFDKYSQRNWLKLTVPRSGDRPIQAYEALNLI